MEQAKQQGEKTDSKQDLGAVAIAIIDSNLYMTLATADEAGPGPRPCGSPQRDTRSSSGSLPAKPGTLATSPRAPR